jgi:hypothetical protein
MTIRDGRIALPVRSPTQIRRQLKARDAATLGAKDLITLGEARKPAIAALARRRK